MSRLLTLKSSFAGLPLPMELTKRKVFIVSAPSGAGKSTLVNAVLQRYDLFSFSISATTRPPRHYETEGEHYYFKSQEAFAELRSADAFLECEEVYSGAWYGTLRTEVDRILANGRCPIFDVDVVGGVNIKQHYQADAVAIYIQAPSLEALRKRLEGRGSDSPEDIARRIAKAEHEHQFRHQFDYIVVNDELEEAVEEMSNIIQQELGVRT
ncbi:MAG: guanylate kinase [Bacteroidota bacterium]